MARHHTVNVARETAWGSESLLVSHFLDYYKWKKYKT